MTAAIGAGRRIGMRGPRRLRVLSRLLCLTGSTQTLRVVLMPARYARVLQQRQIPTLLGGYDSGTALGGPLTSALGAASTLLLSGVTTVGLAALAAPLIRRDRSNGR